MKVIDISERPSEHWRPGVETRMLVSAGNGAAQLCIFEQWVAPGNGAPTHSHPVEEVLTVREGEAEMWLDQQRVTVSAGQSFIVPAGAYESLKAAVKPLGLSAVALATPPAVPSATAERPDRKSTRLNSSHLKLTRMPSSA